jgi:hypothetical protein
MFSLVGKGKSAGAEKTSNETKKEDSVKFAIDIADKVYSAIDSLLKWHSPQNQTCNSEEEFRSYIGSLLYLVSIKDKLNQAEKANPSIKDLAIVKFCHSIAENGELYKELSDFAKKCGVIGYTTHNEELYSQLNKVAASLNKHQLKEKISFLKRLKEKNDFNAIRNDYNNKWDFDGLLRNIIGDKDFEKTYLDKAINEEDSSFSQSFKKDLSEYIKLENQAEETASKYFGEEVEFYAYYTKANDGISKILNINLINHSGDEPTRISDIL